MANDFSGDANCVALYTFENDWPTSGILDDEKGGNDCVDNNTVTRDGANQKEGSYCADFEVDNDEYFNRADADLSSDFPGKSGTGNVDFSFCFWHKCESEPVDRTLLSKYDSGTDERSWRIYWEATGNRLKVAIGYNGGVSMVEVQHLGAMVVGQWYHIGIIYDDDGGADSKGNVKIRIWDDNASAILQSDGNDTHSEDIGQQLSVDSADFLIGAYLLNGSAVFHYDGLIDELVIFKDLLTEAEIDEIRAGTYAVAGGQQYEKSVSFGNQVNMILASQGEFHHAISLGAQAGYQAASQGEFIDAVQFAAQMGYGTAIAFDKAVTFGVQLGFAVASQLIADGKVTLGTQMQLTAAAQAIFESAITLALNAGMLQEGAAIEEYEESVSFALNAAISFAARMLWEEVKKPGEIFKESDESPGTGWAETSKPSGDWKEKKN